MPIAFPISPAVNETYSYAGREWLCVAVNPNAWRLHINAGQVGTGWQEFGAVVVSVLPFSTDLDRTTWLHKVYI